MPSVGVRHSDGVMDRVSGARVPAIARGGACIDNSGAYRYALWREWCEGPRVAFVMLNPSTADATTDDPTIRRCAAFARSWGFGSVEVVNLCAYRTASPAGLLAVPEAVGAANAEHVAAAVDRAELVVVAWGNHGLRWLPGVRDVLDGRRLWCLGVTRQRAPRHPLYVAAGTVLSGYVLV